jgi:hypothetical protein
MLFGICVNNFVQRFIQLKGKKKQGAIFFYFG